MDETAAAGQEGPAWYEVLIGDVVRAAAAKRFSTPQLQSGMSYYVDANGTAVPMGQPVPGQVAATATTVLSNPMVVMAGLAFVGVILYKLVK